MEDVLRSLNAAQRTAMIHLGVASVPDNTFRGFDYAANLLNTYDDKNYT
jgi:hypothetical protein